MLFAILLVGLVLRLVSLNQSLWLDEATSVLTARDLSFNEILTEFSPGDFHPPLYYLMLKVWVGIFGASEIGARSMSVVFGLATSPVVFLIGRRLFDRKVGLIAALFLATAPLHIYYSQEARMYVTATFFAALLILFFVKILEQKWSWVNIAGLGISMILLLYTDYPPIFLVLSLGAFFMFFNIIKLTANTNKWLLFVFIVVLFFIPWLPTFIKQLSGGLSVESSSSGWWQVLGKTSIKELLLVPVKFIIGRISSYDKTLYAALIGVPAAIFGLLFLKAFKLWSKTKLLWFWLVGSIGLAALFGLFASGFSYFRLLFVLPAFYLLLAVGAFALDGKWKKLAVVSVLLVNIIATNIYLFTPRFHREDWRGAVSWIEEETNNKAVVFVTKGQQEAYRYYAKQTPIVDYTTLGSTSFDTIFLMRYAQPIFDSPDTMRQRIENLGYTKIDERDFNGVVIWRYQK